MSAVSQYGHLAAQNTCSLTCRVPVSVQGCLHTFCVHCVLMAWACLFVLVVFRVPGRCKGTLVCMCAVSQHRHMVGQHACLHTSTSSTFMWLYVHMCLCACCVFALPPGDMGMPVCTPSQHHYLVIRAFWFAPLTCPSATAWHHGNGCLQAVFVQLCHVAVQTVFYSVPVMLHRVSRHEHTYLHTCCVQVMPHACAGGLVCMQCRHTHS